MSTNPGPFDGESFDTVKNAREGLEEALYWHTVGILADSGANIGTAVAVRWNNHCIFLTANHVVRSTANEELRFYFRPQGTMKRAEWGSVPSGPLNLEPPLELHVFDRFESSSMDVAALIVSPILDKQVNVRFHDLSENPKLPKHFKEPVAAIGYPADSKKHFSPNLQAIAPCNIWGNVHNGKAGRPEDFRPRTNLLLKFFPAELGVHPGGFSGAGIWYHKPTPKPEVWSPNLALAGICTHYYPRRTLLLITRVERLVTFLDKIAPGR